MDHYKLIRALIARIRELEEEGEVCQNCGKKVDLVWHAPDKLWKSVTDFKGGGGILCIGCFEALVEEHLHTFLYWSCDTLDFPGLRFTEGRAELVEDKE